MGHSSPAELGTCMMLMLSIFSNIAHILKLEPEWNTTMLTPDIYKAQFSTNATFMNDTAFWKCDLKDDLNNVRGIFT